MIRDRKTSEENPQCYCRMLHESFEANHRGRLRYCRETSRNGSRIAFAKSNPCRNGRPTERQTIARCRLTSVTGSHLVAVAYPSSINRREWCLEGGGAWRAISISYAVGILAPYRYMHVERVQIRGRPPSHTIVRARGKYPSKQLQ